jgi:iron-sulfur cluster repair protein YtfE (RIC family)
MNDLLIYIIIKNEQALREIIFLCTMKRHPALAPFSRDHHESLILAQLIKKGASRYQGMPETIEGKRNFAILFFNEHLAGHFSKEEKILFAASKGIDDETDRLISELTDEHREIESLVEKLKVNSEVMSNLDQLGYLLESHIRKEERILFPLLQEKMSEEQLARIEKLLVDSAE